MTQSIHVVTIGSLRRMLPIREVAPGVRVALFNPLGDPDVNEEAGKMLAKLVPWNTDVLLMADGKAQALLHVIGRETGLKTIVARKTVKPYMEGVISTEVRTITTGKPQLLHLSGDDVKDLWRQNVTFVDDVVSTGATLDALKALLAQVESTHLGTLAVFTEGTPRSDVTALGHLPLF